MFIRFCNWCDSREVSVLGLRLPITDWVCLVSLAASFGLIIFLPYLN